MDKTSYDDLFNLSEVKQDLRRGTIECNKRGLQQSAKWLAEINFSLKASPSSPPEDTHHLLEEGIAASELDRYYMAKSYFDCREYDRAAYFLTECQSPVPKFLHYYSTYMAREKRKLDNMTEDLIIEYNKSAQPHMDRGLADLMDTLKMEHNDNKLDGYCLYLYGVVLKKLELNEQAMDVLLEAVRQVPTLWAAWYELALIINDRQRLYRLALPQHWMRHIFYAHTLVELSLNDEGIKLYEDLEAAGFTCFYTTSQLALAYLNNRGEFCFIPLESPLIFNYFLSDVERALEIFEELQRQDPYRLDNLDMYSNVLFIKDMRVEMAQLAHKVVEINKYRPESCCVIGNYFSIRSEHQKAILYFQRALKLNPKYLFAWTLMGHEFMETKNTNGAIQSYRKAIEVHRRDFRAWYGLGQAYEILKMPIYSLYYYKMSHQLRPNDSRMLVALGETYEKLDRSEYALKCYQKACNVGDIEGYALLKLGYLYEKLGEMEKAVPAFLSFCAMERGTADKVTQYKTYLKLGHYYETVGNYREAQHFAQTALEHEETKLEAKALLKTINKKLEAVQGASGGSSSVATAATITEIRVDANNLSGDVPMDESDMILMPAEEEKEKKKTRRTVGLGAEDEDDEEDRISVASNAFSSRESLTLSLDFDSEDGGGGNAGGEGGVGGNDSSMNITTG